VLHLAARYASTTAALTVRPDQFVYVDELVTDIFTARPVGDRSPRPPGATASTPTVGPLRTVRIQQWRSADGTHDGLERGAGAEVRLPGCVNGHTLDADGRPSGERCEPEPAAPDGLPNSAGAMLQYLRQLAERDNATDAVSAGLWLSLTSYLSPAVQAAVFEALAQEPGISVLPDLTDVAGRHGIAVVHTDGGVRAALIFDPATHAFLGGRTDVVGTDNVPGLPVGVTPWSIAHLQIAITDRPGQPVG